MHDCLLEHVSIVSNRAPFHSSSPGLLYGRTSPTGVGDMTDTCLSTIEFPRSIQTRSLAALIVWMLFLRGDEGVKGGPKGRRRRRSATLDTIISPKRMLPSDQGHYPPFV